MGKKVTDIRIFAQGCGCGIVMLIAWWIVIGTTVYVVTWAMQVPQ